MEIIYNNRSGNNSFNFRDYYLEYINYDYEKNNLILRLRKNVIESVDMKFCMLKMFDMKNFNLINSSNPIIKEISYLGDDELKKVYNKYDELKNNTSLYKNVYIKLSFTNGNEFLILCEELVINN